MKVSEFIRDSKDIYGSDVTLKVFEGNSLMCLSHGLNVPDEYLDYEVHSYQFSEFLNTLCLIILPF